MSEHGPLKPEPPQKLSRVSRTASFWILLVLMSILVVQFMRGTEEGTTELVYSEFVQQLEADNLLASHLGTQAEFACGYQLLADIASLLTGSAVVTPPDRCSFPPLTDVLYTNKSACVPSSSGASSSKNTSMPQPVGTLSA